MSNFFPKLEDATDEQLKHWVNEGNFQVVPLASEGFLWKKAENSVNFTAAQTIQNVRTQKIYKNT